MDISSFLTEPQRATRVPEVVTPSPAVRENALTVFRSDPAALKSSALSVLDVKVPQVITTQADASKWAERLSEVRTVRKNIETRRKQIVEPLKREAKEVEAEAHRWDDPLIAYEEDVKRALSAFIRLDEDRKRREEEARQEAMRKAATQQEHARIMENTEAVEAASVELARIETQAPAVPVTGFKTDAGTIGTRKSWVVEVVKVEDVPPMYLMPDMPKLRAAVKGGIRVIPGCSITEESDLTVRTR